MAAGSLPLVLQGGAPTMTAAHCLPRGCPLLPGVQVQPQVEPQEGHDPRVTALYGKGGNVSLLDDP